MEEVGADVCIGNITMLYVIKYIYIFLELKFIWCIFPRVKFSNPHSTFSISRQLKYRQGNLYNFHWIFYFFYIIKNCAIWKIFPCVYFACKEIILMFLKYLAIFFSTPTIILFQGFAIFFFNTLQNIKGYEQYKKKNMKSQHKKN